MSVSETMALVKLWVRIRIGRGGRKDSRGPSSLSGGVQLYVGSS